MTAISKSFGDAGSNLMPNDASGEPSLARTLRELADDLVAFKGAAPVLPALPVFSNPPTVGEMAALQALVNELRLGQVTRAGVVLKTTKV